jgi:glycosyltransferase involved in cell wall biosynthesis
MEWLRTWRYVPNCRWAAHEPPRLAALQPDGSWADQGLLKPLRHEETEAAGLVFHHYAYARESQLRFKEIYYGYANAVEGWRRLQAQTEFPRALKEFFPWVRDETQVDRTERLGVPDLAEAGALLSADLPSGPRSADVVIDGVFFQYYNTGIARVWRSLLKEWAQTEMGPRLLILDRGGKAPRIPGLRYLDFPAHNYGDLSADRELVQEACDYAGARVFISSYYSAPLTTPSIMLVHDMIPELLGADLSQPMWVEKTHAVETASAFVCVSEKTAQDLVRFHPEIPAGRITVAHNGVSFGQPSPERLAAFQQKYGIEKPYFQLSGARSSYKNTIQFFGAFAKLGEQRNAYAIVCTGPGEALPPEFAALAGEASVHMLDLSDEELECAYGGALALVYPSLYEGFGMPIIEAMACGCPVITCPTGPLPEVAGEAAIYVPPHDLEETFRALCRVQDPDVRADFVAKGLERARRFSWRKMAAQIAAVAESVLA